MVGRVHQVMDLADPFILKVSNDLFGKLFNAKDRERTCDKGVGGRWGEGCVILRRPYCSRICLCS